MRIVAASGNQFTSVEFQKSPNLTYLEFQKNNISNVTLNNLPKLVYADFYFNQLTFLPDFVFEGVLQTTYPAGKSYDTTSHLILQIYLVCFATNDFSLFSWFRMITRLLGPFRLEYSTRLFDSWIFLAIKSTTLQTSCFSSLRVWKAKLFYLFLIDSLHVRIYCW